MRLEGIVDKSWGHEEIVISNDHYCLKYLHFDKKGSKTSMHFHKEKHETWQITKGCFLVRILDTTTAQVTNKLLNQGDIWVNEPMIPHQVEAIEDGSIILEVSTADSVEDNYRLYR